MSKALEIDIFEALVDRMLGSARLPGASAVAKAPSSTMSANGKPTRTEGAR